MADTNFLLVYVICKGPWHCVQSVSSAGALEKEMGPAQHGKH